MLKSLKRLLSRLLDAVLPPRSDYQLVKEMDEQMMLEIPESQSISMPWIKALFAYKDKRTRAIIWELKYKGNTLPLQYIGQIFYDEIIDYISNITLFDTHARFILVPIPISTERRKERGYNQSEYIAKAILEHDTSRILVYAPQWLVKIKDTATQSHSASKEERFTNLRGCFQANSGVAGSYIILIDDVTTTGSTLSEARSALLSVGAKDVTGFTIAH